MESQDSEKEEKAPSEASITEGIDISSKTDGEENSLSDEKNAETQSSPDNEGESVMAESPVNNEDRKYSSVNNSPKEGDDLNSEKVGMESVIVESGEADCVDSAETATAPIIDESSGDNEEKINSNNGQDHEDGNEEDNQSSVIVAVGPQNEQDGLATVVTLPEESELLVADLQRHWKALFPTNNDDHDECPPARTMLDQIMSKYSSQIERFTLQEDDMAKLQANIVTSVERQSQLEQEVSTLRNLRDENETKCNYLQNKLVETQKSKASLENLKPLQSQLQQVTSDKQKLEQSMEKLKRKCVERVKLAESALQEERQLNEERKDKMREYVHQKSEELRASADVNSAFKLELRETNDALRQVKHKLDILTEQYTTSQQRNREITRELHHLQKNKQQWMEIGENMEAELQKTTMETEEHKHKRLTAKHELMTVLRKLEAEQAITAQLRDSIKFTFTPKALSQQQLLQEGMNELEAELIRLSKRLGKNTSIPINGNYHSSNIESNNNSNIPKSSKRKSRLEVDVTRLLTTLENETQKVSQGIMSFTGCVEQLHRMLDDSGDRTCVDVLTKLLQSSQQHKPLSQTISNDDDEHYEEGAFVQTKL